MKVLIATNNPGKVEGAKLAFEKYFDKVEIIPINASSDVPDEPVNEEIYKGARNRVENLKKYAKENNIEADFYVAIEAGITNLFGDWININISAIEDSKGKKSWGTGQAFPIPNRYVDEIREKDLGTVMDKIFSGTELRRGKGGISFLTHGEISRIDITKNAFIMALTQYINGEIWE